MKRGEIYWANFPDQGGTEQRGRRPAAIFYETKFASRGSSVVVIPLTTNIKRRTLPTSLFIPKGEGGLPEDSVALVDQIRSIDKARIDLRIGMLSNEYMKKLDIVVKTALGIA